MAAESSARVSAEAAMSRRDSRQRTPVGSLPRAGGRFRERGSRGIAWAGETMRIPACSLIASKALSPETMRSACTVSARAITWSSSRSSGTTCGVEAGRTSCASAR
jgi:hypothetical protein